MHEIKLSIMTTHQKISSRELQVLKLISNEFTTQEVAKQLYISNYTAETHRKNLIYKLGVRNTAGLVRKGFELGYLQIRKQTPVPVLHMAY